MIDKPTTSEILGFTVTLQLITQDSWRQRWKYTVITPTGVVFDGDSLGTPRSYCKESSFDKIALQLLFLICIGLGDTDSDYFSDYSPEQLEWANSYSCEEAMNNILMREEEEERENEHE